MNALHTVTNTFSRTAGRAVIAAAIGALSVTSFSVQANELDKGYQNSDVPLTSTRIDGRRAPSNLSFKFKLGGIGGFGRSDYFFEDQKQQFERSSTVDESRINPYDKGNSDAFGSTINYDKPIYRSDNSSARGSFNSLNR